MKQLTIIIFFTFLIISCKKTTITSLPSKQSELIQPISLLNTNITDQLSRIGGDVPKDKVKYIDTDFIDLNSQTKKLSDYSGNVILLNLWATWCPPCRAEMPSMETLYKKFKNKNFTILAVSVGEPLPTVKSFIQKTNYTFPIFVDNNNQTAATYGTGSIPTTYLFDKDGYIIARFVGGREWNSDEVFQLIEQLIK